MMLKILFLAKFAPINNKDYKKDTDYVDEYALYHQELYTELQKFGNVIPSNDFEDIIKYKDDIDLIFSVYNKANFRGSEVLSSTLAEYYQVPYIGARPTIRAIAEDKHLAKMVAKKAKVPTPDWTIHNYGDDLEELRIDFAGDYFVKPRYGANSSDISLESKQKDIKFLKERIAYLHKHGKEDLIIEECIDGVYYTVPAIKIDNKITVLPSIRQYSSNEGNIVTNKQKIHKEDGLKRNINVDLELHNILEKYTRSIYALLEPLDYARFDFMVDEKTKTPYFIELNICCSLSQRSTFVMAAKEYGIEYPRLIDIIINNGIKRKC